jgi:hypothetical protein
VFYWLEEFLGKYSFNFTNESHLRFLDTKSPLYKALRGKPVQCLQTLNIIPKGKVKILADLGTQIKLPVISSVSIAPENGEIYLVPQFLIKDEPEKLVDAFGDIAREQKEKSFKPGWIAEFERQIDFVDPYKQEIKRIEQEIGKLEQALISAEARQAENLLFTGLLFKTGEDLKKLVENTFKFMGFYFPEPPPAILKSGLDLYMRDNQAEHIVGRICSSSNGPISYFEYARLVNILDNFKMKKDFKVLMIVNANCSAPPEERSSWFDDEIIEENKLRGFCLISTIQLFEIVDNLLQRSDLKSVEAAKRSFRKDIIEADGKFTINKSKYVVGT